MKKKTCLTLLIFLTVVLGQVAAAQANQQNPIALNDAQVCFVDFRIGLVVGKSEGDIADNQYCKYTIEKKKFLSLLTTLPASAFYMGNNVRAKVSLTENDAYFVDYNGVVRFGSKKFKIDKMLFKKTLRSIKVGNVSARPIQPSR